LDFGKAFNPFSTIEDYTGFFLAVILGLGITFELPSSFFSFRCSASSTPSSDQNTSLRHPRHLPYRRHHLPYAGPDRHVPSSPHPCWFFI